MDFSLEQRTARLGVGEFAGFTLGPQDGGAGQSGAWRAQLGTYWHQQLRNQAASEQAATQFEVAIEGRVFHRGWTLAFTGRIDQLLAVAGETVLREIKTVSRPLPADERELRRDYPEYFVQLATYVSLWRLRPPAGDATSPSRSDGDREVAPPSSPTLRGELVFV